MGFREHIEIVKGDITALVVDAIVNAANERLAGGGGVDGAIHAAAGYGLIEECIKLGGCETGKAKITGGYRLAASHVIHTVGPVWSGGGEGEEQLLASCYRECLALAQANRLRTIAFPAISTGVYRFPKERAAQIALAMSRVWLEENGFPLDITFCCYNDEDEALYVRTLAAMA